MDNTLKILSSWANKDGNISTIPEILDWVKEKNETVFVSIEKIAPKPDDFWYFDSESGTILNRNKSFFEIKGLQQFENESVVLEQPVIMQPEIGYLGIICKEINGTLNFLMQAKIEPGNVNKIQISPTIQATKSNFTQRHGGKKPPYLDYFINASSYEIIVDQIQSEQSSRFFKKRNRNIIIKVDCDVEVLPSHKWMTLGQLKTLMKYENLVNMDTRTVLSCIPYCTGVYSPDELIEFEKCFTDKTIYKSIFENNSEKIIPKIYNYINNAKMFNERESKITRLDSLSDWSFDKNEFVCNHPYDFKIVFCDIQMEGREVKRWTQPLFEAIGMAFFGLFMCNDNGTKKFLVRCKKEVGCFDTIELGPTVQAEPTNPIDKSNDYLAKMFYRKYKDKDGVKYDTILSEEGGRFYHEQNYNVIIEVSKDEIELPDGCFWADFRSLNLLNQVNNCLNIQLRNLLSLLEA